MTAFLRSILMAVTFIGAMASVPAMAEANDPVPFFYNITTDDGWTAGMALAQANVAAARGHDVTVFLNVRAVHIADKNTVQGTFGPAGKTPAELLSALVAKGQTVLVCGTCMKAGGVSPDDLVPGAKQSGPDLTFGALTGEGTIVMSY